MRKEADKALQILSKKSKRSQNETLNIILEDSYEEYTLFRDIEKYWEFKPNDIVIVSKTMYLGEKKSLIRWKISLEKTKEKIKCLLKLSFLAKIELLEKNLLEAQEKEKLVKKLVEYQLHAKDVLASAFLDKPVAETKQQTYAVYPKEILKDHVPLEKYYNKVPVMGVVDLAIA